MTKKAIKNDTIKATKKTDDETVEVKIGKDTPSGVKSKAKFQMDLDNAVANGLICVRKVFKASENIADITSKLDDELTKSEATKAFKAYCTTLDIFKRTFVLIKAADQYDKKSKYNKLLFNNSMSYLKLKVCKFPARARVTDNIDDPVADNADIINDIEVVAVEDNDLSKAGRIATCNKVFAIFEKKWNIPFIEVQAVFFDAMNPAS